jgi:hypothetical protein
MQTVACSAEMALLILMAVHVANAVSPVVVQYQAVQDLTLVCAQAIMDLARAVLKVTHMAVCTACNMCPWWAVALLQLEVSDGVLNICCQ